MIVHHRKTPDLSADDQLRVEWAYKTRVKGRYVIGLDCDFVTVQFTEPPELSDQYNWPISDTKIKYLSAKFSAESIGYHTADGDAWEWVNVYCEYKGVKVCIDHWRYDSRHKHYRQANQF